MAAPDRAAAAQPDPGAILRCTRCLGQLSTRPSEPAGLCCTSCLSFYPVINGTPRMVLDGQANTAKERTAESFAYEWRRFGGLRPEWERNFADYMKPLSADQLAGQLLLDVGAGSGRHSFYAAKAGAHVVAVDLGDAIDVARRNLPMEVLTVQADAERLPFAPGTFDIVMSIGVLHHLPDPEAGLRRIVELARPGGRVHVYLYWLPEQRWHRAVLSGVNIARRVSTRLPHRVLHALCYPFAAILLALFVAPYRVLRRRTRTSRLAAKLPLQAYADYPFGVLVNDQFDRFSAFIEHRYTREEVVGMMQRAGLENVVVLPNYGWVADGVRRVAT